MTLNRSETLALWAIVHVAHPNHHLAARLKAWLDAQPLMEEEA